MSVVISIFALFIAATGWHYAFHSVAGARLASFEAGSSNRSRVLMRRAGGLSLLTMGVLFYIGFKPGLEPLWFIVIWLAVLLLLIVAVVLALLDVRLTRRLRRQQSSRDLS